MDAAKLRGWAWHCQGLDGTLVGCEPAMVLTQAGWARSVGGANPYMTLWSRAGTGRAGTDAAVAALEIHELPSVRGCTYLLPAADFSLGLQLARPAAQANLAVVERLGVRQAEIEQLGHAVVEALSEASEPLDPRQLTSALGDRVRNLGEEGRKRGASTTLPTALTQLQAFGQIRRVPLDGRLDRQRYAYCVWEPAVTGITDGAARVELLRRYFDWTGGATAAQSRWFSSFSLAQTTAAIAELDLTDVGDGLLVPAEKLPDFQSFELPAEPQYRLLAGTDGLVLLRRNSSELFDAGDAGRLVPGDKTGIGVQPDLPDHPILDRGRIVGLWQFDPETADIAAWVFAGRPDDALRSEIDRTARWIVDDLGDFRSYSLDSVKARRPRIDALRASSA
ncbi:MAG: winged helix DNA-binding domain-containing protein [Actinomycetota bacterium]|nr:winged helix DNA-binding domain-containing protein [Actinomycetota bacterium]